MFFRKPAKKENEFTTQYELLEEHQQSNGLCAPLANLAAKATITNIPMETNSDKLYVLAVEEENHQVELSDAGKDGLHSAFIDLNIAYKTSDLPLENKFPSQFEELLDNSEYALITYPTKRNDKHMVFFNRNIDNTCSFFDANKLGGRITGPCPNVVAYMKESISSELPSQPSPQDRIRLAKT